MTDFHQLSTRLATILHQPSSSSSLATSMIPSILSSSPVSAAVATAASPSPSPSPSVSSSSSSSSSSSPAGAVASVASKAAARAIDPDYQMPGWIQSLVGFIQHFNSPEGSSTRRKAVIALLLFLGGSFIYNRGYLAPKARRLKKEEEEKQKLDKTQPSGRKKVAVDKVFFIRLAKILRIVIPSLTSIEFLYLNILTALLISRTFFSIEIAELVGVNAQTLVSRKWGKLWQGIKKFAWLTIPASAVNAGLKYYTEMLSLRFRLRLSQHVHDVYLDGSNFYKAVNLGGNRIDNADQRVTADIKDFSDEISALYASILKPGLDVVLFTYKLGQILGWQGPFVMHCYFFLSGLVKKNIMPNLGRLVAKESELEGYYRTAHNRLITNSEEIAFYDGSKKEKIIINNALQNIYHHIKLARGVKAAIGVFDGLLVKYYASIAGYLTLLSPLVLDLEFTRGLKTGDLTRDYIRNSQYLGNLSTAVGQLVIVGNKLTSIAGYTSRVSELLEMVDLLNRVGNVRFEIKPEEVKAVELVQSWAEQEDWIKQWKQRCDAQTEARFAIRHSNHIDIPTVIGGGTIEVGKSIIFEHVDIVSPEGKLLVHDLNFRVDPGVNVMVTGPNGVGKSSLFRIIGELWPLHSGKLIKPHKEDILFVPQKPYLVLGTLRDQIIYPHTHKDMIALGVTDEDLGNLLSIVDPAKNITREWTWDTVKDWFHAFSGGQKQRVAMARLFYHRPAFAILDECTSAVSDEVEDTIYATCRKLGITIFTVSHRAQLARHHEKILRFEGGGGKWTALNVDREKLNAEQAALPKLSVIPNEQEKKIEEQQQKELQKAKEEEKVKDTNSTPNGAHSANGQENGINNNSAPSASASASSSTSPAAGPAATPIPSNKSNLPIVEVTSSPAPSVVPSTEDSNGVEAPKNGIDTEVNGGEGATEDGDAAVAVNGSNGKNGAGKDKKHRKKKH